MIVEIPKSAPCRCGGCRWYKRSEEQGHCKNVESIWYLRVTACRCRRKEFAGEEKPLS